MTTVSRILRGPIFVLFLLFLACAVPTMPASAHSVVAESNGVLPNSPALSCKPTKHMGCVLPNVRASEGGLPVNENPIAANPTNQNNLLTGGFDNNCTSSYLGFYASLDSGKTWNHTCMGVLPGASNGGGDPSVGFDSTGVAYITGIETNPPNGEDVVFEKSMDGGMTWSAPVVAVKPLLPGSSSITDEDWLSIDTSASSPYVNALYVTATQNDQSGHTEISVSHSTNGGSTWTTTAVEGEQTSPSVDYYSNVTTNKAGIVFVTWLHCVATGSMGGCDGTKATFYVSKSTDGGNTWGPPVTIGTAMLAPAPKTCSSSFFFFGCLPNTREPLSNIPVIGVDNTTGNIYVVNYTYTGKYTKVQVTVSTDGGATWGTPIAVAPSTDTHDQFFPWLSVSSTGAIAVTWLDRRHDPKNLLYEAFAAIEKIASSLSTHNGQIATKPSNPNNDGFGGTFMGDYTGNTWDGSTLYASWMDNSGVSSNVSGSGSGNQDVVGGYACPVGVGRKLSGC